MPDAENASLPRVTLMGDIISMWKVPENIEDELYELYNRIIAPFTSEMCVYDGDLSRQWTNIALEIDISMRSVTSNET